MQKKQKAKRGPAASLLFAIGGFLLSFLLVTLFASFVGFLLHDPLNAAPALGLCAVLVAAFLAGFAVRGKHEDKTVPLLAALTFTLLLIAAGLIGAAGKLPLATLLSDLASFPAALLGIFLAGKKPKARRRYR